MKEIRNECLNTSLRNINELGFNQQSILKMCILDKNAKVYQQYPTPLHYMKYSIWIHRSMTKTWLTPMPQQTSYQMVPLTMKKIFPTTWTNEVFCKFLLINIKSPDILLRHILNGTLNPKLQTNNFLSMNNTTLQVLARVISHFNIRIGNEDTNPWSKPWFLRKKETMLELQDSCMQRVDLFKDSWWSKK